MEQPQVEHIIIAIYTIGMSAAARTESVLLTRRFSYVA